MKRKGSTSDFASQRNEELRRAFFSQDTYSTGDENLRKVLKTPTSRFWVDPDNARDVISRVIKNPALFSKMKPERERMYRALLEKYAEIQRQYPKLSRVACVSMAIYSGAPEFYIAPATARAILYSN